MTGRLAFTRSAKVAVTGLLGTAAFTLVGPQRADALPVNVEVPGFGTYSFDVFTGSVGNSSKFNTSTLPWFSNGTTAGIFALAVKNCTPLTCGGASSNFGISQDPDLGIFVGPLFATRFSQQSGASSGESIRTSDSTQEAFLVGANTSLQYAVATCVGGKCNEKVPAPLPILGASAAFGFSRRLRRRIGNRVSA